jgi:hypothetical protein
MIQGRRNMRSPAGAAFLLVVLLSASLAAELPNGASPIVGREPLSGPSHPQAVKAECALPDRCVGQASAGEADEFRPVETSESAAATPSSVPATVASGCAQSHMDRHALS